MSMTAYADYGIQLRPSSCIQVRALCPHCAPAHNNRNQTLSINQCKGVWKCHRCQWSGALSGKERQAVINQITTRAPADRQKTKEAIELAIARSFPLAASSAAVARDYLAARGLSAILTRGLYPDDLHYHPGLSYYDHGQLLGVWPALLAVVRSRHDDAMCAVHRTYLDRAGTSKAAVPSPRKLWQWREGAAVGGAIRLYPAAPKLAVTEGIETALALRDGWGMPAWAAIYAENLARLVLPSGINYVVIGADHDASGTGERCARQLAARLRRERRRAVISMPKHVGQDWLDVLVSKQRVEKLGEQKRILA